MNTIRRLQLHPFTRLAGMALVSILLGLAGCESSDTSEQPATLLPGVAMSDTRAQFEAHLGTEFDVLYDANHRLRTELVSVEDAGAEDARLDQFTVLFRALEDPALMEQTYDFEHPVLGAFRLFVKPAPDADGEQYYEGAVSILLVDTDVDGLS